MSWRDERSLLRGSGPTATPVAGARPPLDPRWDRLLSSLHQLAKGFGVPDIAIRLGLSRGRAAALRDPEGSRTTLVGLIQLMVASLEIAPAEIYGEPTPKPIEPAADTTVAGGAGTGAVAPAAERLPALTPEQQAAVQAAVAKALEARGG